MEQILLESLSDVISEIPLSPGNLLTMKSDVIMPPPGVLTDQTCTHVDNGDKCSILLGILVFLVKRIPSESPSKHDKNGI